MTENDRTATEQDRDLAQNLTAGLRDLAQFIETYPELAGGFQHALMSSGISAHLRAEDKAALQGWYAKAAARHGAKVDKDIDDQWHNLTVTFVGGVRVAVLAYRDEVCERVITGVETVTKQVPDPEKLAAVPLVEVTEEVEQVDWVCRPLLASEVS